MMFHFGVQEIVTSRSVAAPGWAYVPDTGGNASVANLQPSSRKRPRTTGPSHQDTTAKQDAKLIRELAALDRDNHRDVSIPVPVRHRDNAGRVSHGKVTPAVRKILQSAKTFANHLSDFEASLAVAAANPPTRQPATSMPATPDIRRGQGTTSMTPLTSKGTRSHKKKQLVNVVSTPTPLRQVSKTPKSEPAPDTMPNVSSLAPGSSVLPPPHPGDNDPLLTSRIPLMPSQEEIAAFLALPPLNYLDAKGPWIDEDRRKPIRRFCEVCGYWGRVKCRTCGGRVCALECMKIHQEECFTKYGA